MKKAIIGYETEKNQINHIRNMMINADEYHSKGIRIPRGLLLCGEPGVGKTVLAKSLAYKGVCFIEFGEALTNEDSLISELINAFEMAKENAPSVLLIDELDKLAGSNGGASSMLNASLNITLLRELDSLADEENVLVVGTCNDTECLGDALMRPGRFDRVINIPSPDEKTRLEIIRYYFDKMDISKSVDYNYLAKISTGFSGAGLECLANEAGIIAIEKENPEITTQDVQDILARMAFSANSYENNMSDEDKKLVAVHEAGHCIVTMLLRPDDMMGVTIRPQGNSSGHSSAAVPEDRIITQTLAEIQIAEAIGGHVAERVVCGEYALGAKDDLYCAIGNLRYLISACGIYGYKYIGRVDPRSKTGTSDSILAEIESLTEEIMNRIDSRVESLITENRALFDVIVDELIKKQTLTREDLEQLLANHQVLNVA